MDHSLYLSSLPKLEPFLFQKKNCCLNWFSLELPPATNHSGYNDWNSKSHRPTLETFFYSTPSSSNLPCYVMILNYEEVEAVTLCKIGDDKHWRFGILSLSEAVAWRYGKLWWTVRLHGLWWKFVSFWWFKLNHSKDISNHLPPLLGLLLWWRWWTKVLLGISISQLLIAVQWKSQYQPITASSRKVQE